MLHVYQIYLCTLFQSMRLIFTLFVIICTITNAYGKLIYLGPAKANQSIDFTLVLPQRNVDILLDKLQMVSDIDSSSYGAYMDQQEILDLIKPSDALVTDVKQWLINNKISYTLRGDNIQCQTDIKKVTNLFKVYIEETLFTKEDENCLL